MLTNPVPKAKKTSNCVARFVNPISFPSSVCVTGLDVDVGAYTFGGSAGGGLPQQLLIGGGGSAQQPPKTNNICSFVNCGEFIPFDFRMKTVFFNLFLVSRLFSSFRFLWLEWSLPLAGRPVVLVGRNSHHVIGFENFYSTLCF